MRTRIFFPIVLASLLTLGLFTALTGQATSSSLDYTLTTADDLALTLSADGQVLSLTMNGDALPITPGPALWVRDMSQAGQVTTPNLLANSGFEGDLNGWRVSQQIDTTITVTDAVHHSGSRALQMVGGNGQHLGTGALATVPVIPVTPSHRYRLSGYFLSSRGCVQGVSGTPLVRQDQMWRGLLRPNGLYVRWWDDIHHSRAIHAGAIADPPPEYPLPPALSQAYEHVVSGVWDGWLPVSLYPYALVEDGAHGLALASSLDSPRLVKLAYDQEKGRYEARSYLGISPQATKVGPDADFRLELYRVEPTWGFRAAMDDFARRHPAWFNSPRSLADYVDYERGSYTSDLPP